MAPLMSHCPSRCHLTPIKPARAPAYLPVLPSCSRVVLLPAHVCCPSPPPSLVANAPRNLSIDTDDVHEFPEAPSFDFPPPRCCSTPPWRLQHRRSSAPPSSTGWWWQSCRKPPVFCFIYVISFTIQKALQIGPFLYFLTPALLSFLACHPALWDLHNNPLFLWK